MIIWFCSLLWVGLIFVVHADTVVVRRQGPIQPPPINFNATFGPDVPTVFLNSPSTIQYNISTAQAILDLSIFLCQTSEPLNDIDSTNSYQVATLFLDLCVNDVGSQLPSCLSQNVKASFDLSSASGFIPTSQDSLTNFFLCFSQSKVPPICDAYSPVFDLIDLKEPQTSRVPPSSRVFTSIGIPITKTGIALAVASSTIFNYGESAATPAPFSLPVTSTSTGSTTYVTIPPSIIATVTPTPTASADTSQPSHSKSSLSTGALVGVIVGAVGGALILAILGLLCLRRRKHTRAARSNSLDSNRQKDILLQQPYTSIGSRDLVVEKGPLTTRTSMLATPIALPTLPNNPRHSYDSLHASAPYTGNAAGPPRPRADSPQKMQMQQNQPAQQSLLSHEIPTPSLRPLPGRFGSRNHGTPASSDQLTRGVSDASAPGTVSSVGGEGDELDDDRDMPIYRDARHTPTLYQTHHPLQVFGEEGMSAEEVARLEEEERRIDAAIAAAEEEEEESRRR